MGCDSHFYTERYTTDDYEGPKDISKERELKLDAVLESKPIEPRWITSDRWIFDGTNWDVDYNSQKYQGRNYYLFAVLADVRNSYGIDPISEPRGVPDDASFAYKKILENWGPDAHSESYFTLRELLDVDWSVYDKDDWLDEFLDTIDKMKGIDPDPEKVRCVFFFDN